VCECALRAHTRISAIQVSLIIIIIIAKASFKLSSLYTEQAPCSEK
jgi:hypothetical protein